MANWTEIEYLRTLNQTFYDQVKTADQKAGYICTFLTILFAYSKDHGNILLFLTKPPSLSIPWILSLVFAATAFFSIACTALVILPRVKAGGTSLYWGSWMRPGANEYKLSGTIADDYIMSEYLTNAKNLAHICWVKYRFVNMAFRGAAATIVCYLGIVLLSHP
jgi:hypothetical protein